MAIVSILIAALAACAAASNSSLSVCPYTPTVFPPRSIFPVNAPAPINPVALYYDFSIPSASISKGKVSAVLKVSKEQKIAVVLPNNVSISTRHIATLPETSSLRESIRAYRTSVLGASTSRSPLTVYDLDPSMALSCIALMFNIAMLVLVSLVPELIIDEIFEEDNMEVAVTHQLSPKSNKNVTFKLPAQDLRTANATMHKAIQVNLDIYPIPVVVLPKLPTIELLDVNSAEIAVSKPEVPVTGSFNSSLLSAVQKTTETRTSKKSLKNADKTEIKKIVAAVKKMKANASTDC